MEKQVSSCLQETFCSFLILGWWNWFRLPGKNSLRSGIYSKFLTPPSIPDGLSHGHKGSADTSLCCVPASPFLSFLHDCQRPPSTLPCWVPAWSLWGWQPRSAFPLMPMYIPCTTPQGYCLAFAILLPIFTSSVLPTTAKGRWTCQQQRTERLPSPSGEDGPPLPPHARSSRRRLLGAREKAEWRQTREGADSPAGAGVMDPTPLQPATEALTWARLQGRLESLQLYTQ